MKSPRSSTRANSNYNRGIIKEVDKSMLEDKPEDYRVTKGEYVDMLKNRANKTTDNAFKADLIKEINHMDNVNHTPRDMQAVFEGSQE